MTFSRILYQQKFGPLNYRNISFKFTEFDSLKRQYETSSKFNLLATGGSTIKPDVTFVGATIECLLSI